MEQAVGDRNAVGVLIGERVRSHRKDRRWTLDELATRSGVSRRMLSAIELGAGNPSIATLLRISDALGVSLAALVDIERTSALVVNRNGTAPILWNGDLGGRALLVAGTEPPDVVELWEWILANGEVHRSEPHALGTRELLLVLEGTVELTVGAEQERLTVGDSAAFRSDVPHSYANPALPGSESSRFVMTVFEPRVGVPS